MSKSGFAKFELQDIEKFRELERHSKETFNNLLESRAKQYSLASLNQRSKKIKGGQTILYTQIANLLQKNEQIQVSNIYVLATKTVPHHP